jgi:hypothetical protein
MKTYTKTHTSTKAADDHVRKIKARGGIVIRKNAKSGNIFLKYTFK